MKIKISGVLSAPTAEVCAGSEIQLKAVTTSNNIIINAESSYFVGQDGKYEFNVYPGRYDVYIQFSAEAPQKVGRIGVYEDSQPGTLEEYLLIDNGGYFKPEALIQFEKDCAAAAASAAAAKSSEDASADSASAAAASAAAAKSSEDASAGSASAAAGSAAAAKLSGDASADSASAAADSAAAAKSSEALLGDIDPENIAYKDKENTFSAENTFKETVRFKKNAYFFNAQFDNYVRFYGDVDVNCNRIVFDTGAEVAFKGGVEFQAGLTIGIGFDEAEFSGLNFYDLNWQAGFGGMYPAYKATTHLLKNTTATKLLLDFESADENALKFKGKDGIEQTLYHSGNLPPAAVVAGELPAEVTQPVFYFDDAVEQLYFLNGDKKYAVTLTPE
ncbi:prophage tail fiber N-terminal domain-containing protein [Salmonella enterica]|nr:prophage tail fiber N-terminal domain-containing protein [Salmonella enterica]EJH2090162.1 prophage tail fiber N-terminal domain-containing protein [Salmonella enterica]